MDIIRRAVPRYGLSALLSTIPSLAFSLLTLSEVKIESALYCVTPFPTFSRSWSMFEEGRVRLRHGGIGVRAKRELVGIWEPSVANENRLFLRVRVGAEVVWPTLTGSAMFAKRWPGASTVDDLDICKV